MGHRWLADELPLGTVDQMFLHELALELRMPVGELGERMSWHELVIEWPEFFHARERERKTAEQKADARRRSV